MRALAVCVVAEVVLLVWVTLDSTPALDGRALLALMVGAIALGIARSAERGHR